MRRRTKVTVAMAAAFLVLMVWFAGLLRHGFSALDQPSAIEVFLARRMRGWSVPADLRGAKNPVPLSPAVLAEARAHFADHCAMCHGNDGKGTSGLGRLMFPPTPDLTRPATQNMSDGEIFSVIENGIRLTGMPGFGSGTAQSAYGSWTLVHFIRHLPKLKPEEMAEMEKLNPKTPAEWQQMQQEEAFLAGDADEPATSPAATPQH